MPKCLVEKGIAGKPEPFDQQGIAAQPGLFTGKGRWVIRATAQSPLVFKIIIAQADTPVPVNGIGQFDPGLPTLFIVVDFIAPAGFVADTPPKTYLSRAHLGINPIVFNAKTAAVNFYITLQFVDALGCDQDHSAACVLAVSQTALAAQDFNSLHIVR